ncbi:MAG: MurR/RpiR family transcriptional regulator [Comamonas sp.]
MLDRISASLASLTPAEQRVGALLLSDPHRFIHSPVRELAEKAQVSKPTVVRFCRSVGFEGLADFKLKLAAAPNSAPTHPTTPTAHPIQTLIAAEFDQAVQALRACQHAISATAIEHAALALAQAISQKRHIAIWGSPETWPAVAYAQQCLLQLNVLPFASSDSDLQKLTVEVFKPQDCVIIFADSTYAGEMHPLLQELSTREVRTIVITTNLSQQSDANQDNSIFIHTPKNNKLLNNIQIIVFEILFNISKSILEK